MKYQDGELAYILAPQRLKAGDTVIAAEKADIKPGNAMPMAAIPVGTMKPARPSTAWIIRAAGAPTSRRR